MSRSANGGTTSPLGGSGSELVVSVRSHLRYAEVAVPGNENDANFMCIDVDGGGSCFFHTIAALTNYQNWHEEADSERRGQIGLDFRTAMLARLEESDAYAKVWRQRNVELSRVLPLQDALACVSQPRKWAHGPVIIAVVDMLGLNLLVVDQLKKSIFCGTHRPSTKRVILMNWVDHRHFEPIVRVRDHEVTLQFRHDDPDVQRILETYREQPCKLRLHENLNVRDNCEQEG